MFSKVNFFFQQRRTFWAFDYFRSVNFNFFHFSRIILVKFFVIFVFLHNLVLDFVDFPQMLRHVRFVAALVPVRHIFDISAAFQARFFYRFFLFRDCQIRQTRLFRFFSLFSRLSSLRLFWRHVFRLVEVVKIFNGADWLVVGIVVVVYVFDGGEGFGEGRCGLGRLTLGKAPTGSRRNFKWLFLKADRLTDRRVVNFRRAELAELDKKPSKLWYFFLN
jgi:hypothetical protein